MFNPNQSVIAQKTEKITGQRLSIDVGPDGGVSIVNDDIQLSFVVHETPCAKGRMKQVHTVCPFYPKIHSACITF